MINYSSKNIWVLSVENEKAVARLLAPKRRTSSVIDVDAIKRQDGWPVDGHNNWWKIYDFSTLEILDNGSELRFSVIAKAAVGEAILAI